MAGTGENSAGLQKNNSKHFSTTGRPFKPITGAREEAAANGGAPVRLLRTPAVSGTGAATLPERLELGGGSSPESLCAVVGRNNHCDARLQLNRASKVHCQLVLRGFQLGDDRDTIHEACFLRDVSRAGTLVNGGIAFRPWHWLQHDDVLGLRVTPDVEPDGILNFYKVEYVSHHKLPGQMVSTEEVQQLALVPPAPSAPAAPPPAPFPDEPPPKAASATSRRKSQPWVWQEAAPLANKFGKDLVGQSIDVTYEDGNKFQVKVTGYDPKTGCHTVDSTGYSEWEGEPFDDTLNLSTMESIRNFKLVGADDEEGEEPAEDGEAVAARVAKRQRRR